MLKTLEKIIPYILGGVIGFVAGIILLSFHLSYFTHHEESSFILTIATLIGIIGTIAYHEYGRAKFLKKDTKIRNEAMALITHEMRTGLTSTGWAIELILNNYVEHIKPDDRKMLEDVLHSIHNTVMHSMNLLDVSLLDIGKFSVSLSWTTLDVVAKTFQETVENYTLGARQHDVKLISNIDLDPLREVEVDITRLRIILENLLENALQYSAGPVKEIEVVITNDSRYLVMQIRDTGIGIPVQEQEKIFGEFYRATNARKKLSTGSGIGLYMCQEYVNLHHGTIRFESEENKGTTFYISIPLKTQADVKEFLKKV